MCEPQFGGRGYMCRKAVVPGYSQGSRSSLLVRGRKSKVACLIQDNARATQSHLRQSEGVHQSSMTCDTIMSTRLHPLCAHSLCIPLLFPVCTAPFSTPSAITCYRTLTFSLSSWNTRVPDPKNWSPLSKMAYLPRYLAILAKMADFWVPISQASYKERPNVSVLF